MDKIYVVTIDEEFEKSRTLGAKDTKPRKKRAPWKVYEVKGKKLFTRRKKTLGGFEQSTLSLFGKTPKSARASIKRQQTKARKMDEIEGKYFPKEVK